MGVWAKATQADTPKAAVEATGEGLRSQVQEVSSVRELVRTSGIIIPTASVKL